ncbi:segregation/condensation protein A [soil metagenome]
MAIDVETPVFEGPFDLLLALILKEQVDLYEISLSSIVERYLSDVDRVRDLDLDDATGFLLIAATLVELKARRLLPGDADVELDDELALWEARDLLVARLAECKTFKDVATVFVQLSDDADRSFPRVTGPDERFATLAPDLLAGVTPERLCAAAMRAMRSPEPISVDISHLAPARVSVAEAAAELVEELALLRRATLRQLTSHCERRIDAIVRFLAVLELFKQGAVEIEQAQWLGDIEVVWLGSQQSVPVMASVDDYEG